MATRLINSKKKRKIARNKQSETIASKKIAQKFGKIKIGNKECLTGKIFGQ